jgi:hypothetical protein
MTPVFRSIGHGLVTPAAPYGQLDEVVHLSWGRVTTDWLRRELKGTRAVAHPRGAHRATPCEGRMTHRQFPGALSLPPVTVLAVSSVWGDDVQPANVSLGPQSGF